MTLINSKGKKQHRTGCCTLFGKNGVQSLDGEKHEHRKEMFMSIIAPDELGKLTGITRKKWELTVEK
jgi:fatty-acid peroxygenase